MSTIYCGHCGLPSTEGSHEVCTHKLELEPPRFCTQCARRMKVQVIPLGWREECVEHGIAVSWTPAAGAEPASDL